MTRQRDTCTTSQEKENRGHHLRVAGRATCAADPASSSSTRKTGEKAKNHAPNATASVSSELAQQISASWPAPTAQQRDKLAALLPPVREMAA